MSSAATAMRSASPKPDTSLRVMGAIEACRTAALGGHVERCESCAHERIAYNSCLMGKIGNGELAREGVPISLILKRFSADLEHFPINLCHNRRRRNS